MKLVLKILVLQTFLLAPFCQANQTQDMSDGKMAVNWQGDPEANPFKRLLPMYLSPGENNKDKAIRTRPGKSPNTIEVFNDKNQKWLSIVVPTIYLEDRYVASHVVSQPKMSGEAFLSTVRLMANCQRLAKLNIKLSNSTAKSWVYVSNERVGPEIDENGMFMGSVEGKCREETVDLLVAKKGCQQFFTTVKILDNPTNYQNSIVLDCPPGIPRGTKSNPDSSPLPHAKISPSSGTK